MKKRRVYLRGSLVVCGKKEVESFGKLGQVFWAARVLRKQFFSAGFLSRRGFRFFGSFLSCTGAVLRESPIPRAGAGFTEIHLQFRLLHFLFIFVWVFGSQCLILFMFNPFLIFLFLAVFSIMLS